MTCVDDYVVHDAFMHNGRLGLSHSRHPVSPQRLPGCCNLTVALHPDPEHFQAHKGRPQSFLVAFAIQEYLVEDDARPLAAIVAIPRYHEASSSRHP